MKIITKETEWQTHEGKRIKFKDLEDTHLANLLNYLSHRFVPYKEQIILVLNEITNERGLKQKFLNKSQIPYKNRNNKWEIWDKEKAFIEIQK